MVDRMAVLLSLMQAAQAGIKQHFKSARIEATTVSGTGRSITFSVHVLDNDFVVTVKFKKEALNDLAEK